MLKTCIRHDLHAYRRYWILLSLAMLGATVVAGGFLRLFLEVNLNQSMDNEVSTALFFIATFGMIAAGFSIFLLFVALAAPTVISLWRMYTHFFTDQGYLTFTLPVKRSTLYLSKLISTLILQTVVFLEFLLSAAILLLVVPPTYGESILSFDVYRQLGDLLRLAWAGLGGWMLVWILLGLVMLVLSVILSFGLYYLCLTIGAVVAKKRKLLAAIGIYYVANMVFSFATQFFTFFFISGIVGAVTRSIENGSYGPVVSILLLLGICVLGVVSLAFHFITLDQIERRLNLA